MTPKMSPAEVMAKTLYEIKVPSDHWKQLKRRQPDLADAYINRIRAALRTFAEMEPTEEMENAMIKTGGNNAYPYCVDADEFKAALLAAAKEGEPQI